jgi:negative regulator of sigma E activity
MSSESECSELLSALLDGEIAGAELDRLLENLDKSEALRERWRRMCAARAAREGLRVNPRQDLCAGVMAALAGAPVPAQDQRVVPLPQRQRDVRRPALGLAAAASIAAVAVAVALRVHSPAPDALVAVNTPVPGGSEAADAAASAETDVARLDADSARRLDDYVIEHSNYRAGGMGGPLSYARFAAHTAEYQPVDGQR